MCANRVRRPGDSLSAKSQRALVQHADRGQAQRAAELHAEVGSTLSGVLLLLALQRARGVPAGPPELAVLLQEVQRAADGVRRISRRMLAAGELDGGLPAALAQLAIECSRADCRCTFRARGECGPISVDQSGHLYRIAEEALANAVRHGDPTRVRTMLACLPGRCRLTLDDDGHGEMAPTPLAQGAGLRAMRLRVLLMGGLLEVKRSPLGGWRVRITVGHGPTLAAGTADDRGRLRARKSFSARPPTV